MADIAMCRNESCEKKEQCYRYTAPVDKYWQTVRHFEGKPCEGFWDNTGVVDGREVGEWWQNDES